MIICGHGSAQIDDAAMTACCNICGDKAPARFLRGEDGEIVGFAVDAWLSDAWVDRTPRPFVELLAAQA